jgi:drug/metabolite transporter (DMT)-like permease
MFLATLFLAPFAMNDFKRGGKKLKDVIIFGQLALLGVFPAQVLMTWGTQYSLASNAAIITLALPVVTAVFAFLLLKEKMNKVRWLSFIIAIIGVILCSTSDLKQLILAQNMHRQLLDLSCIVCNAYYNTGIKKIASRYSEMELLFFTYVVMIILLTPLVLYYERDVFERIPVFTKQTWTGMALLTFFHNFLSMLLFFKALKVLDAIQVALSNYLITFFGLPVAAYGSVKNLTVLLLPEVSWC